MTEDEVAGWHHCFKHEFGLTLEVGDRQRGLECLSSLGRQELDMTQQLN